MILVPKTSFMWCFKGAIFPAGLCLLIGAAVYGDKRKCGSSDSRNSFTGYSSCPDLAIALWIFASFAEIVAGIFAILEIVGVQNKVQSSEWMDWEFTPP